MTLKRLLLGLTGTSLMLGLCGSALAQAEFTYTGVADFSYGRFEPSGLNSSKRFNSNSLSASFISGTAKYGLDGGWTPGITLETFVRFQDLKTGRKDSDPTLSRNAFAFLNSKYGNLRVGRMQTFLFDTTVRFNAFGNSVPFSPAVRHVFAGGNLVGVQGDFYWDRAVSYSSPSMKGVTVNMMGTVSKQRDEGQLRGTSVVWAYGLLATSIAVQKVSIDDGLHDPTNETTMQLGATYNFGFARVFGLHTQTQDHGLDVHSKLYSAGVLVPLGPGSVLGQIGVAKATGPAVDRKQTTKSAGYLYPYDSETDLYALTMQDKVRGQTPGLSLAVGVRLKF